MEKNKKLSVIILFFIVFVSSIYKVKAQEALIWQKYTGKISNPEIPMLFDYSYAGYKLGEVGIPKKQKHIKKIKWTL